MSGFTLYTALFTQERSTRFPWAAMQHAKVSPLALLGIAQFSQIVLPISTFPFCRHGANPIWVEISGSW